MERHGYWRLEKNNSDEEEQIMLPEAASRHTSTIQRMNSEEATKPHFSELKISAVEFPQEEDAIVEVRGKPLERHILRASISILTPSLLVSYYVLTYLRWLRHPMDSTRGWIVQGYLDNAEIVNYSWFIIATFALNIGAYASAGSISAMIMTKRWDPGNARRLLGLASNSFGDPSRWLKIPIDIIKHRSLRNNGRLWNLLAIINIAGFIAWPLTGLTMQTQDGYALGSKSSTIGGMVVGRNFTTFVEAMRISGINQLISKQITTGFNNLLPYGQFYTQDNSDSPPHVTENIMPENATTPIFLTIQAPAPFTGNKLFGLLVQYDCSIVKKMEDFTILNHRRTNLKVEDIGYGILYPVESVDNGSTIVFLNFKASNSSDYNGAGSVTARMEIGIDTPLKDLLKENVVSYYRNSTHEMPRINKSIVMEVALWQAPRRGTPHIENEIPELAGLYPDPRDGHLPTKAIGCRCVSSSEIGYADIDGTTSTYSNFEMVGSTDSEAITVLDRFEIAIVEILSGYADGDTKVEEESIAISDTFELKQDQNGNWWLQLWTATGLWYRRYSLVDGSATLNGIIEQDDLRSTILRYFSNYALALMYPGGSSKSKLDEWYSPNIIIFPKTKILAPGVVPPIIVLAILIFWGASTISLAIIYQFRKRWAEKLDPINVFKLGVSRPEGITPVDLAVKPEPALEKLPGMVGDLNADGSVGKIGLTRGRGTVLKTRKPYA